MMARISRSELEKCRHNVAMKSSEHLKEWLEASGRRWLVFDSRHLVDALAFPDGISDLMRVIAAYAAHRSQIPNGKYEVQRDPILGKEIEVPLTLKDQLDVPELDRLIRYLIRTITEKDSSWNIGNPPM